MNLDDFTARVKGQDLACGGDTLAEGIAVKSPGEFTSKIIAELVDDILLVEERELENAVSLLLQIEKQIKDLIRYFKELIKSFQAVKTL